MTKGHFWLTFLCGLCFGYAISAGLTTSGVTALIAALVFGVLLIFWMVYYDKLEFENVSHETNAPQHSDL